MEKNEIKILIKNKENIIEDRDHDMIVDMTCKMAVETENLVLERDIVSGGVESFLKNENYGKYFLAYNKEKNIFCGMSLITYEHNLLIGKIITWIVTVYVDENYRNQGIFRKLFTANSEFIIGGENFEKSVKLYLDKNNHKAEEVYKRLGFSQTQDVLYEFDYNMDNLDLLNNFIDNVESEFQFKKGGSYHT